MRSRRRLILAVATSALIAGGAVILPATAAAALPCMAWQGIITYDPKTDVFTQDTYYCVAYWNDPPADPKADRPTDPGAGGGGSTAKPGSPESCSDVADEITRLRAEIETLKIRERSILFDISLREKDFAAAMKTFTDAINRTSVARQARDDAWTSYLEHDGEAEIQYDSRGKPSHPSPAVQAAATRLAMAIAAETQPRADAVYAARRLNDSNDQLAAVRRDGAKADTSLAAALARQAAEKCPL